MSWRTAAILALGLAAGTALVMAWVGLQVLVAAIVIAIELGAGAA